MRPLLASTTLVLAFGLLGFAAAPPASPRESDRLDYLFLGSDRPVMIRLHVRVGDKPYGAAWIDFMDEMFARFDKDKDGFLSSIETARLPSARSLLNLLSGSISQDVGVVAVAALDTNKDGRVSKEEFRAYYRSGGFTGFQFATDNSQATVAKQINDGIYKRLDKAGEGNLTAAKVAGMVEKLRALDENEDEMLDRGELTPRANSEGNLGGISTYPGGPVVADTAEPTLLDISPAAEAALVKQMVGKYDRNKDGKLTRAEIGLAPALFARLDADGDGTLDAAELRGYLASAPDLVLRLQVGTPGAAAGKGFLSRMGMARPVRRLVVVNDTSLAGPMKEAIRTGTDDLALALSDTQLALQVFGAPRFAGAKQFYLQQFDAIAGKKGHVERSDEKGQLPFLFQIFSQADGDADGKLTRRELIDWLDFVGTGQEANVTITAADLGRGIFPVLDADGDGRLSHREMKGAWARLKPLAKGGRVTKADFPRTLRITVGSSVNSNFERPDAFPTATGGPSRPTPRASAPVWFRKMDRNNDGDVSRREWLGTDEEFAAADADGDGLISAAEAIAFEAKKSKRD